MRAARAGNLPGVEMLLNAGAKINIRNNKGNTPLHVAAYAGHEEIVHILLERGAKINIKNVTSVTPLYHATVRNYPRVIQNLLRYGAYSYSDNDTVAKELYEYWEESIINLPEYRSFYTTLLLSGVSAEGQTLPEPLSMIQRNIEDTVAKWLQPLNLSKDECRDIAPKALRALPPLIRWLQLIDRIDRQTKQKEKRNVLYENYGLSFFESARKDADNASLLTLLGSKLPQELENLIQERFTQRTLIDPIATFLQDTYALPWNVVHYLAHEGLTHPNYYVNLLSGLFEHDWQAPYTAFINDSTATADTTLAIHSLRP